MGARRRRDRPRHARPAEVLPGLIEAKILGEHRALAGVDRRPAPDRLEADLAHWQEQLRLARETSDLPEQPPAFDEVHDFVVDLGPS